VKNQSSWKRAVYSILIREGHLDSFGHVNNATYLQLFEEARWQFVTERGFGYAEVHQRMMGPTILEIQMRFLKEVRLRQEMEIHSWVESYEGKVGEFVQEFRDQGGAVYCRAHFKFGLFDIRQRKLISPTPEWLKAIGGTV